MRKIVDVWLIKDCCCENIEKSLAYPTMKDAENAAKRAQFGGWYKNGYTLEMAKFPVPNDAFWVMDLISVEIKRGAITDDDGISSGGEWEQVYGLVGVDSVNLETGRVNGFIFEPGTDRHIQTMELRSGVDGYPYRAAKLVRADDGGER